MADQNNRDYRQRSLGCFGVSVMAHVGLLALLALAPQSNALQPLGLPDGTAPGAVTVDLSTPATGENEPSAAAASPNAAPAEQATAPSEVLLASNDDPTGVALPATEKVERVEPKKIAAPVDMPEEKPVAKPKAPKLASKPKAKPVTQDEGDVEIKSALAAARIEEEEKPQALAEKEETTQEPSEPQEPMSPPDEDDTEAEVVEREEPKQSNIAAAMIAPAQAEEPAPQPAAQAPAKPQAMAAAPAPQMQAPAQAQPATAAQPSAIATAPAQAMPAPYSQQASGGAIAQPGVAAARPGATAAGQSVQSGGLGYAVPLGVRIRDASEIVARPNNPKPIYPQQDRLLGRQGTAVLIGRVSPDGSILSVQLERSSGSPSMDQEALKAFAKWKYMPGQQGLVRVPIQFQLMGSAKEMPAKLRR